MKVVSLNTWAGKEFNALMDYLREREKNTDVFCFQEVFDTPTENKIVNKFYRANLFSEFQRTLPNHIGYYAPALDSHGFDGPENFPISWGLAMFVRKSLRIEGTGEIYIRGYRNSKKGDNTTIPRNLQYVKINVEGRDYIIAHFHGLWNGKGKTDTEERIAQSKKARAFLDKLEGKKVLCGDFNLLPDTESLKILEEGFVNLIKTHGINTTRSSLYEKPDKFADYTLVSPDVKVERFEVPNVNASDHLPMELEFF